MNGQKGWKNMKTKFKKLPDMLILKTGSEHDRENLIFVDEICGGEVFSRQHTGPVPEGGEHGGAAGHGDGGAEPKQPASSHLRT